MGLREQAHSFSPRHGSVGLHSGNSLWGIEKESPQKSYTLRKWRRDAAFFSMVMKTRMISGLLGCGLLLTGLAMGGVERVDAVLDVAPVWAGHPVGFALLTEQGRQYVAYYDVRRRLTVASRALDAAAWEFVELPRTTGWDSHNSIAMALDAGGHLHLSGEMHCVPLVYFRMQRPHDLASLERMPGMVGRNEARCTYPKFIRGAENELVFTYRDGGSGNGNQWFNVYDPAERVWRRLLERPLTDGEGQRNAYFVGPLRGPDGYFHLCWVWRETPDAATNHDLCYARSKDMRRWERSDGRELALPVTLATSEVVDPVPVNGGMVNGNTLIGFDSRKRPILSYHKFDGRGFTQIYNARLEEGSWRIYRTSDWNQRWEFGGGGTLSFGVGLGPVQLEPDGRLTQRYRSPWAGSGTWVLDEATLQPVGEAAARADYPAELRKVESTFPGMTVRWCGDSGMGGDPGVRYVLRWETLGPNRDQPRTGELPPPGMLRLFKLRTDR